MKLKFLGAAREVTWSKHPICDHPKCGAKMQRVNKRENSAFVSCAWMCTDCRQFKKDIEQYTFDML